MQEIPEKDLASAVRLYCDVDNTLQLPQTPVSLQLNQERDEDADRLIPHLSYEKNTRFYNLFQEKFVSSKCNINSNSLGTKRRSQNQVVSYPDFIHVLISPPIKKLEKPKNETQCESSNNNCLKTDDQWLDIHTLTLGFKVSEEITPEASEGDLNVSSFCLIICSASQYALNLTYDLDPNSCDL